MAWLWGCWEASVVQSDNLVVAVRGKMCGVLQLEESGRYSWLSIGLVLVEGRGRSAVMQRFGTLSLC